MIDFALVGKLGSSLIAQTEKFGENKNIQICEINMKGLEILLADRVPHKKCFI